MSASDVLPLDPDYGLDPEDHDGVLRTMMESGRMAKRQKRAAQRIFTLPYRGRSTDDVELMRVFRRTVAADYFVFNHKVWVNNAGTYLTRKFPVEWLDDTLSEPLRGNEQIDFEVRLIEAVGKTLAAAGDYPDPTGGHLSFFIEENDPSRVFKVNLTGVDTNSYNHASRAEYGDWQVSGEITFVYSGYGFRYWCVKDFNLGKVEVFLDGVSLGILDLYNATLLSTAARFTKLDVPLGLHRVKLKFTGTKNASSAGYVFYADALEVMF